MKRIFVLLLIPCIWSCTERKSKPQLVVGIVVDQMRMEYLHRFSDDFSAGLKRLLDDGFLYQNAHYNYIPTKTGPGHASIYTGSTPAKHGIIGNDWYVPAIGRDMNCVEDTTAVGVGGVPESGRVSPRNLKSTTITDELRLFYNFKSKVVSISIKDRGATLPGGHNPTGAYWYDLKSGRMMTSSFYAPELPSWVKEFNQLERYKELLNQEWDYLRDTSVYNESIEDDNPYEREAWKGLGTTFPYDYSKVNGDPSAIKYSPWGNTLVKEFAMTALQAEQLGKDRTPDFLAISFSATDDLGHAFGPRSKEVQDVYLRLDQEIGELLAYLDTNVGRNAYTVFLTADHGANDVPSYLVKNKMPGGYYSKAYLENLLNEQISAAYGQGKWVERIINEQVYLDRELIRAKRVDMVDIQRLAAEVLRQEDYVTQALISQDVAARSFTDPLLISLQNGYKSSISGDVLFVLAPGFLEGSYGRKGTDHRTGFNYDTNIPILFYGSSVNAGRSTKRVEITDIAPTVAMLLDISLPNASIGSPLQEVLD